VIESRGNPSKMRRCSLSPPFPFREEVTPSFVIGSDRAPPPPDLESPLPPLLLKEMCPIAFFFFDEEERRPREKPLEEWRSSLPADFLLSLFRVGVLSSYLKSWPCVRADLFSPDEMSHNLPPRSRRSHSTRRADGSFSREEKETLPPPPFSPANSSKTLSFSFLSRLSENSP